MPSWRSGLVSYLISQYGHQSGANAGYLVTKHIILELTGRWLVTGHCALTPMDMGKCARGDLKAAAHT
jgi:hypothetical protein